jgi:thiamine pyrophosphokinase
LTQGGPSPISPAMSAPNTKQHGTVFTLLLAGSLSVTPRLLAQIAGTRAIAADGGMAHAAALGLHPELWVGDFDSTPSDLLAANRSVARLVFDPAKAKSDGELAVEAALERGATALVLAGGLGGTRTDHQMIILAAAAALAARDIPVLLTSGHEEAAIVLPGQMRVDLPEGTVFSIIGFEDLTGLSIGGARWPLEQANVPFGSTLTLSNIATGAVTVTLSGGRAALFAQFGKAS